MNKVAHTYYVEINTGRWPTHVQNLAKIYLYDDTGTPFMAIEFLPDDMDLKDPFELGGIAKLFYHWKQFPVILEILRTEKPVHASCHEVGKRGRIYFGREPVGEEESVGGT